MFVNIVQGCFVFQVLVARNKILVNFEDFSLKMKDITWNRIKDSFMVYETNMVNNKRTENLH